MLLSLHGANTMDPEVLTANYMIHESVMKGTGDQVWYSN
jgi:hypothetical protein